LIATVLVPGAGGAAAINTIKSLRMANFTGKIVSTDSNPLSAGFFMTDTHKVMPKIEDPSFVNSLFQLVAQCNIEVLMPCSGFDIFPYSENRDRLAEIGVHAIVSDRDCLEICRDKMLTYNFLSGKFDLPFTTMDPDKVRGFPVVAKPRFGKGSRDITKIEDESDLNYITRKYEKYQLQMIYQELLPGTEYTVDVLSDLDRQPLMAVPRTRLETKAGISTKGRIMRNSELEETCLKMAKAVGISGPCCIQMKESREADPRLVEINPRLGGGTIFTTLAGANFPAMILDMVNGTKVTIPQISEITIIRHFEEIVLDASALWREEQASRASTVHIGTMKVSES
jgi:carbamoyl-phosphate synthase large subunit